MSYAMLGQVQTVAACPPCSIAVTNCVPCAREADSPECKGCIEVRAAPEQSVWRRYGPEIAVGVVTTVLVTVASAYVLRRAKLG